MTSLSLQFVKGRAQVGCKGPRAAGWLAGQGLGVPADPNSYSLAPEAGGDLVLARLGSSEFFLEQEAAGDTLRRVAAGIATSPPGVYPVLREDCGWLLTGTEAVAMLAEVCNVNFAALDLSTRPVIMTLMVGVAVLIVPQAGAGERQYRIWCDPTYGPSLGETLQGVIVECGGTYLGVTA
jgi:sarcosine oxidase, subunit gamma